MASVKNAERLAADTQQLRKLASEKPFLWLHRPRWEHVENTTGEPCPCCDSPHAIRLADEDYLDLLVSKVEGDRVLLETPQDFETFRDELRNADRYDIPFRCHHEQRRVADAAPKILLVSGGVGAGKSAVGACSVADEVLRYGGPGVSIWWVAPELKHLIIAINKLFVGEYNGADRRYEPPVFPPDFVDHHPTNPNQKNLVATLRDGTEIQLWHASNATQFKGRSPRLVVIDEGAAIKDPEILNQLRDRAMRNNGRIIIPTTPLIPSPIKEIRDDGIPLGEWDPDDYAAKVHHHFTSFDNPWIPNEWIQNNIKLALRGDKTRIRREIYGEWIGDGTQLWATFDPVRHLYGGQWRTVEDLGLRNITAFATRKFFRNQQKPIEHYGGQDFNLNPMSTEIKQIAVPPGLNEADPKNWIYVTVDEVVEANDIFNFCDTLIANGYAGLHIACDADGAQDKYRVGHGIKKGSTFAAEMERRGFVCKSCNLSDNGHPKNPPVKDRIGISKKLFYDTVKDKDGREWPRKIVHAGRCPQLIRALEGQEDAGDGTPLKESGTAADRLAGPSDADTYGDWAIAHPHEYRRPTKWH